MTTKSEAFVPNALREVWAWKEAVYRETEGMGLSDALAHIHREAEAVRRAFDLKTAVPLVGLPGVAEDPAVYETGKDL